MLYYNVIAINIYMRLYIQTVRMLVSRINNLISITQTYVSTIYLF